MPSQTKKYDKQNRLHYHNISDIGITYTYKYRKGKRIVNIFCPTNRSNFFTLIIQILNEDNKYTDTYSHYVGDKFIFEKVYNTHGRLIVKRSFSRKTGRLIEVKNFLVNEYDNSPLIWVEKDYKHKNKQLYFIITNIKEMLKKTLK